MINPYKCPDNMTMRQLMVLDILLRGRMRLKDIAIELHAPKPSVCRAFSTLVRSGLIERVREEDDKRMVYGVLTDKGGKFLGEIGE